MPSHTGQEVEQTHVNGNNTNRWSPAMLLGAKNIIGEFLHVPRIGELKLCSSAFLSTWFSQDTNKRTKYIIIFDTSKNYDTNKMKTPNSTLSVFQL